jgi:hypothetical protein
MNRPISTKAHGMIDYAWATAACTFPRLMDEARATARLVRNAGSIAGLTSMMTNYEAGVVRVMPMRGHLALDFLVCAALLMSPLFLPRSERRYAAVPVALGVIGFVSGLLTQTESSLERSTEFTPSHELSEAVADPDIARTPHLRAHLE